MPKKGRFVIHVKSGTDDTSHPREFDARHQTWEAAKREKEHSSPAPPGLKYTIVKETEPNSDPFGAKKEKNAKSLVRKSKKPKGFAR
jgi:hypothetical protein